MQKFSVIITGATGMVGEGVLLECLNNPSVSEVLMINRRPFSISHPKLKELIVPDFEKIEEQRSSLAGYDACFYCAGVSVIGKTEQEYRKFIYDTTLHVAKILSDINPLMVFTFVTGSHTDSTEKGTIMWARVKGKTENDLMKLTFKGQYNFRPGVMIPYPGQKNVRWFFKPIISIAKFFSPAKVLSLSEVGKAMISTVTKGYEKNILEIEDIKKLAAGH